MRSMKPVFEKSGKPKELAKVQRHGHKLYSQAYLESEKKLGSPKNVAILDVRSQDRKGLVQNQQKKAKNLLQSTVAKRQLDFAERQKDSLYSQNRRLKHEVSCLQKDLLTLRDNQQRQKRKAELEAYQKNSEIQRNRVIITELKDANKALTCKAELLLELQHEFETLKTEISNKNEQLQRLNQLNYELAQKSKVIEQNYENLFQNYAKLQVSSQSLQRQLFITKDYLSKTQALHSSSKDESYRVHEQKAKQLEQKAVTILNLNREISSLNKKASELGSLLQKRQSTIDQLEREKTNHISAQTQKSNLETQVGLLRLAVNKLQEQNKLISSQAAQLKQTCELQLLKLHGTEISYQRLGLENKLSQRQWVSTLKQQVKRISQEKNEHIIMLENQVLLVGQRNKQLEQIVSKAQSENEHLKQLLNNKQHEISDYLAKVKQCIEKQGAYAQERDKMHRKQAELLGEIDKLQERVNRTAEELHSTKVQSHRNARASEIEATQLKERLMQKEISMKNAQLEMAKHKQKTTTLIASKEFKQNHRQYLPARQRRDERYPSEPISISADIQSVFSKAKTYINTLNIKREQLQQLNALLEEALEIINYNMMELTERAAKEEQLKNNLSLQNQNMKAKMLDIESGMSRISHILQQKTRTCKILQEQMIQLEHSSLEWLQQSLQKQQKNFKKQLLQQKSLNEQLKREVGMLSLYKIKSQQSETRYEEQRQAMSRQIKDLGQQNGSLKKDLQRISQQLPSSNAKITAPIAQVERVTKSQPQEQTQAKLAITFNGSSLDQKQGHSSLMPENTNQAAETIGVTVGVTVGEMVGSGETEQRGRLNYRLQVVDKELEEIKHLLNSLKQQRDIFVKQYILIYNEVAQGKNSGQLRQPLENIGGHFTQLSLLHTRLHHSVTRAQHLVAQISMGHTGESVGSS